MKIVSKNVDYLFHISFDENRHRLNVLKLLKNNAVVCKKDSGAAERTRTFDLLINSQLHYRAVQRRQTLVLSSFRFTRLFKFSLSKNNLFDLPNFILCNR